MIPIAPHTHDRLWILGPDSSMVENLAVTFLTLCPFLSVIYLCKNAKDTLNSVKKH